MGTISAIAQLVVVLSALIILHEIGHYIGARLFKFKVDEFGIGIPPEALRYWRGKGHLQINNMRIEVPAGRKVLQDLEVGTWVDVEVKKRVNGEYELKSLEVPDPKLEPLVASQEMTSNGNLRIRNALSAVELGMLFTLNWLPLGGFVKIRGEGDTNIPEGLAAANPWKRILVYAFGPLMNLLIGVLLYSVIVMQVGVADPTQVKIIEVAPNSPADEAGLIVNDLILEINQTRVNNMITLQETIYENLGEEIQITFERDGRTSVTQMVPREDPPQNEGAIGIVMGNPVIEVPWYQAVPLGAVSTYQHSMALLTLPAQVIRGAISPEVARPVGYKGMYDIYQNVQERELVPGAPPSLNTIWFFTTITISLGILNLLPIPALDGGRILFALPEILFRRKIPIEIQNLVNMISFTIMILLFFYINYLDFVNPVQLP